MQIFASEHEDEEQALHKPAIVNVELELKHNNKNEDINQCSQRTQKIFFFSMKRSPNRIFKPTPVLQFRNLLIKFNIRFITVKYLNYPKFATL